MVVFTEDVWCMESNGLRCHEGGTKQPGEVSTLQRGAMEHRSLVGGNVEEGHGTRDDLVAGLP